jgi:hypothetical protein
MSFCEHCEGQRFDRSRVLRELRRIRKQFRDGGHRECERALSLALSAVKALDVPHLELEEDLGDYVH